MKKKELKRAVDYEIGSDNVFADLGFENAEEELLKSDLTGEIAHLIKKKRLTQAQAAKILKVDQPRISALIRGKLDLFSVDMLMHFLQTLGQDIKIVVTPKPRNRKRAHLYACISETTRTPTPIAAHPR